MNFTIMILRLIKFTETEPSAERTPEQDAVYQLLEALRDEAATQTLATAVRAELGTTPEAEGPSAPENRPVPPVRRPQPTGGTYTVHSGGKKYGPYPYNDPIVERHFPRPVPLSLFTERREMATKAEEWCEHHAVPQTPFNLVTAIISLGVLCQPRKFNPSSHLENLF